MEKVSRGNVEQRQTTRTGLGYLLMLSRVSNCQCKDKPKEEVCDIFDDIKGADENWKIKKELGHASGTS